jgi:hypothetical protein
MCVFVSICARAVRPCVFACLCERMCGFVRFHRIAIPRVCAPRRCARPPIARRGLAVFIARPAPRVAAAPRGCGSARPAGCRARSAAGVTWTCRTASAGWAGRYQHTSVVDAAGAIYVLGGNGYNGTVTYYHDVWASTDGGARAGLGRGGGQGVHSVGYSRGYSSGVRRVLRSTKGVLWGTAEYRGGSMGPRRGSWG